MHNPNTLSTNSHSPCLKFSVTWGNFLEIKSQQSERTRKWQMGEATCGPSTKTQKVRLDKYILRATVSMAWHRKLLLLTGSVKIYFKSKVVKSFMQTKLPLHFPTDSHSTQLTGRHEVNHIYYHDILQIKRQRWAQCTVYSIYFTFHMKISWGWLHKRSYFRRYLHSFHYSKHGLHSTNISDSEYNYY